MIKRFLKKTIAAALCLVMIAAAGPMAGAYYYCDQTVITGPAEEHISKIMADLDRQNFGSEEQRQQVKSAVSYLLSESSFAALEQGSFPYMNAGGYAETVSDGAYSFTVWAAGCYAYAKWASQLVYGEGMTGNQLYVKNSTGENIWSVWSLTAEGLKYFIRNHCQAGEHIRIDYVHSVCFLACSDDGIYFTDYAGDTRPYIRLCYTSYENFFNAVRTGSSFWLSDVVTLENEPEPEPDREPEPEPGTIEIELQIDNPLISVNGESYYIDSLGTTPLIRNDRTLLPIRAVVEAMGGRVEWEQSTKTVTLHNDGKTLKLRINQWYMWDQMGVIPIDTPPAIIGDRTMVPLRAVVEYFGAKVHWDNVDRMATIIYTES